MIDVFLEVKNMKISVEKVAKNYLDLELLTIY